MALDGVRALVFDTFGTVVDWRGGLIAAATPFLQRHTGSAERAAEFADAWYQGYPNYIVEWRSGRRGFVRMDVFVREAVEKILPDFGVDPAKVPAVELTELAQGWRRLPPWPDAVPGLTRLKQNYIVAPLSNGNIAMLLEMAKRGGLPWDAILGAEIAQAYKTSPEAYLRNLEALDMAPQEVCMVAAHNVDLAAARKAGMRTAYVIRPLEKGPPPRPIPPSEDWDEVVDDFLQLAERFGV